MKTHFGFSNTDKNEVILPIREIVAQNTIQLKNSSQCETNAHEMEVEEILI